MQEPIPPGRPTPPRAAPVHTSESPTPQSRPTVLASLTKLTGVHDDEEISTGSTRPPPMPMARPTNLITAALNNAPQQQPVKVVNVAAKAETPVNAAVKAIQKSARQIQFGDEADESVLAELAARVASVEEQVESIEIQDQIWDAMKKLSPRQRAVIVQRYFLEMSEREMAEQAGSAIGTVKWMLNAARERLRGLLTERSEK